MGAQHSWNKCRGGGLNPTDMKKPALGGHGFSLNGLQLVDATGNNCVRLFQNR